MEPRLMREQALEIFGAAIRAVDPEEAVRRHVEVAGGAVRFGAHRFDLAGIERVLVVGAGKAAAPMAAALEDILGSRIAGGAVVVKEGHGLHLERIEVREGGHPVPDERGLRGTRDILSIVEGAGDRDLVVCVFSGGGSALLLAPVGGVSVRDKQETTRLLLACGATIGEINAVRKHLSLVKGGRLARAARPARVVTLLLSDVVRDDSSVIASGPTAPDPTTFREAEEVLSRRGVWAAAPRAVRDHILAGVRGERGETPDEGDPAFDGSVRVLVGSNMQALEAARQEAERRGYRASIRSAAVEGEAREVGELYAAIAREIAASGRAPACVLGGGETTVTLRGGGRGGRNQELALAAALGLEGVGEALLLSAGTDGTDGPTDAAGATADGGTAARARALGLEPADYLGRNDSYTFFKALGDLVVTGPTRTNVMDLHVLLVGVR